MIDLRIARSGEQIFLKFFDRLFTTLGKRFDAAVFEVFNVPQNLMSRGRSLSKKSEAYALHLSADQEFSRNSLRFYHLQKSKTECELSSALTRHDRGPAYDDRTQQPRDRRYHNKHLRGY